jgi:hypothetical protein
VLTLRHALWTAAVGVAVVITAGGCGSGSAGSGGSGGSGSGVRAQGSTAVPSDFPPGLPLPSGSPLQVSGGQLTRNTWTWTLRYPGNGHPDVVGRTESSALTKAGFTAMIGGVAEDTFTRGSVQVTTAVSRTDFTMTVNMTS